MDKDLKKLLIIEDDLFFKRALCEALEAQFDFPIIHAETLAEAKELVARMGDQIFLALADLNLPDGNNGEIISTLQTKPIPTIIITSEYSASHRKKLSEKPHVLDYIMKDDPEFIGQIKKIIIRMSKNRNYPVLIADDSPTMRRIITNLLKKQGFPLLQAEDGETALALIQERRDIRLLITDYNMPGLDGFQLTRRIRQKGRDRNQLIIIGISSEDNPELPARFLKMGANDFLQKPFSGEGLYQRIVNNLEIMEQIEELKRLNETKNRFIGMAAHDLRNPINGIMGLSRLMLSSRGIERQGHPPLTQENMPPVDEEGQFLLLIEDSATHMKYLVDDLLDISAIGEGRFSIKPRPLALKTFLNERLKVFRPMARNKEQTITTSVGDTTLNLDPQRFTQVIDNLLSNGIKYTPPGGEIAISLTLSDQTAQLAVCDTGPGVPEGDEQRLFSPYTKGSAKPTGGEKSIGLGLTITKKIVEAHGGTIRAVNQPQGGACFIVTLPLSDKT